MVVSGPGSVHFVPVVLTMYPEFGPVWHGQSSVCVGPYSRVPGIQCVPVLIMHPEFRPVWHGQCSMCANPSHVPGLWSSLAWTVFSACQPWSCTRIVVQSGISSVQCASLSHVPGIRPSGMGSVQCVPILVRTRVDAGNNVSLKTEDVGLTLSLVALGWILLGFWDRVGCPFVTTFTCRKEMTCCGCCSLFPLFVKESACVIPLFPKQYSEQRSRTLCL